MLGSLLMTFILTSSVFACLVSLWFLLDSVTNMEWKRAWFFSTLIGAIIALYVSIIPGNLEFFISGIPFIIIAVPVLFIWVFATFLLAFHDIVVAFRRSEFKSMKWGINSAILFFAVSMLLTLDIVRSAVFSYFCSDFRVLLPAAPDRLYRDAHNNQRIGPYVVDLFCKDERGGVYFRTSATPEGPDILSHGFAYRPNLNGAPFGKSSYKINRIYGDWYVFSISDDWQQRNAVDMESLAIKSQGTTILLSQHKHFGSF